MQEGKALVSKLYEQLEGKVMIAAELTDSDIGSASIDDLSAKVLAFFEGYNGLKILDKRTLDEIQMHTEVKEPIEVVVARQDSFNPESKNFESDYRIRDMRVERTGATVNDFAAYFRDRYRRLRDILSGGNIGMVISTDRIGQYAIGREVSIVGMVYDKAITKKGNLMVTLEDEFGTAKIIFVRPSGPGRSPTSILFESAMKLVTDEVIAVRGKMGTPPLVIATQLIWPDVPVRVRKQTREDMAIALTSDVHVGSRFFIEGMFIKFIEWLNGNVDRGRGLAGKVKYVIIGGDVADGIGVYPGQDRELSISDVYKQYSAFMNYIEDIPEYIEVFVIPGNHDAVQLADPQPMLTRELTGDFKMNNVHFLPSPSYVEIEGLKTLVYHGTSLDSVIHSIAGCSYSRPEEAMIEILKRRHVSPIYGSHPVMPSRSDALVMPDAPDILHMGHVHKNGLADYHGTQVVNSGTWQGKTGYQEKMGHTPTPGILPVYETKRATVTTIDFNGL
jgi:DNA polymerase II small subunit